MPVFNMCNPYPNKSAAGNRVQALCSIYGEKHTMYCGQQYHLTMFCLNIGKFFIGSKLESNNYPIKTISVGNAAFQVRRSHYCCSHVSVWRNWMLHGLQHHINHSRICLCGELYQQTVWLGADSQPTVPCYQSPFKRKRSWRILWLSNKQTNSQLMSQRLKKRGLKEQSTHRLDIHNNTYLSAHNCAQH